MRGSRAQARRLTLVLTLVLEGFASGHQSADDFELDDAYSSRSFEAEGENPLAADGAQSERFAPPS